MAILYTDNLNGNDTTGNGTIATPYKTINKAMTVGTNGDEIRVAGSGFTALSGTVTATTNTGTTWNTSVNLTGVLLPGDIITVNDAEFGDQKFFYKVFSVGATSIVVDGGWNRTPNVALTFSKVTTQHYYTTTTGVTFENVNIAGKSDFKITGGWVNNFTEQTGWTVMNFQGATATANSGTGFTAVTGSGTGNMYFDRFMLSHLTTGFAGSTNRWYPGNLAFVFFGTTSPYGAAAVSPHPVYGTPDQYYTNSTLITALGTSANVGENVQLSFNNVYYGMTAQSGATSAIQHKVNNFYSRLNWVTSLQIFGAVIGRSMNIDNLYVSTANTPGTVEIIPIFNSASTSSSTINNSINVLGPNTSYRVAFVGSATNKSFNQIKINTNIEDLFANGIETNFVSIGDSISSFQSGTFIFDSEGEKQVYNNGNIAYADPLVFDTGTNSLRTSKTNNVGAAIPGFLPVFQYYNNNSSAKTITIRAKASANTPVVFGLWNTKTKTNTNGATGTTFLNPQTINVTTNWADYTYTGFDADIASIISNGYTALLARTDAMTAKYLWIDSVTIS